MNKQQINRSEPTYFSILPADVRYSRQLTPMAKIIYAELTSLASKNGKCWPSNQYFADLYDVQPTTVSEWINSLFKAGFINISGAESKNRRISIANIIKKKSKLPSEEAEAKPSEKVEHNNTSNNNKNNISETSKTSSQPFNFSNYITSILQNSKEKKNWTRYFAAYFLKRKGLTFNSAASVEGAMKQHYTWAKQLGEFTGDMDKIKEAFNRAENLVVNGQKVDWKLSTVVKMISQ